MEHSILGRRSTAAAIAVTALVVLTACSDDNMDSSMNHSGTQSTPGMSTGAHDPGMPGMEGSGNGLSDNSAGLTLKPGSTNLPAGQDIELTFEIVGLDGKPVTEFQPEQTKLMHFYLIRNDLTGFQHVHPTMAPDGTWTAPVTALQPGAYRIYTQFTATGADGKSVTPVLSVGMQISGQPSPVPLPPATPSTSVDGYALAVTQDLKSGREGQLTLTLSTDGQPVTDLEPYLDSYAHLTAIHEQDLAFAHLHPEGTVSGDRGGPTLSFSATLPNPGNWRLFIQFQTGGTLHTAEITLKL